MLLDAIIIAICLSPLVLTLHLGGIIWLGERRQGNTERGKKSFLILNGLGMTVSIIFLTFVYTKM